MKRFWAIILTLCMALSLTACSDTSDSLSEEFSSSQDNSVSESTSDGKVHLADGTVFPEEPLTLVCSYAAGGSSDIMCRKIAEMSSEYFGVNANVVNVEGGNAAVALGQAASSVNPDGYTLTMYAFSNFSVMPYVQDLAYSEDTLHLLHGVSEEPLGVMVKSDSPWNSLQDVVDYYKETGNTIMHGQSGTNGAPHMNSLLMFDAMGVEQQIVAYSGASTALAALLGNEIDMVITQPTNAHSMIEGGEVKVIAMFTDGRTDMYPDVATVEEQGFGSLYCSSVKGFCLPVDTDPEIVEWFDARFGELATSDEWLEFIATYGISECTSDGAEMLERIHQETLTCWPPMEQMGILKPGATKPDV